MLALVGYSGYVGSTLLKQASFKSLYRSTNIQEIEGHYFDTVVCAGAPAQKWIANKEPESDLQKIKSLISHLKKVECKTFVLISTVDVFESPIGVDETTVIDVEGLHAYGLHRRLLEKFVESHFENHLIVRLPGLVGPGLRKNVIFDFLNDNNLNMIDCRGNFQFYPMVNLWSDIQVALINNLKLVHLTAEPISVTDIASKGFGLNFMHTLENPPANYDMRSIHSSFFAGQNGYQYSQKETLLAVRAYAQSESKTIMD
jgi:dTDP-4-dehydrorhamnose reductase